MLYCTVLYYTVLYVLPTEQHAGAGQDLPRGEHWPHLPTDALHIPLSFPQVRWVFWRLIRKIDDNICLSEKVKAVR